MATKTAKTLPAIVATKDYSVNDLAEMLANVRGVSVDKAAKDVRRRLRADFPEITKMDARILKVKTRANDGVRWPAVNGKVAAHVMKPSKAARAA